MHMCCILTCLKPSMIEKSIEIFLVLSCVCPNLSSFVKRSD